MFNLKSPCPLLQRGKRKAPLLKGKEFVFLFVVMLIAQRSAFSENSKDSVRTYVAPTITITSTRAEQFVSPVAISEITSEELKSSYIMSDMPALLNFQPSVVAYSQNGNWVGYSNLTIRGFDQRRIAVLINGIPQNDPEDHQVYWIDFPDIASNLESIQVQRGAGASAYGSAAIGGSVNLTTSNFVNKRGVTVFSGIGFQEYGSGKEHLIQATTNKQSFEISSGIIDKYAFYGRLSRIYSAGYRDRSWTELNSYFLSAIRFDDNFTTQLNVFGGPISDGLAYTGLPKSYIKNDSLRRLNPAYYGWGYNAAGDSVTYFTERRKEEVEGFSQPHFELLLDYKISENMKFNSSIFYYAGDGYFDNDASWADAATLRIDTTYGFNPTQEPTNTLMRCFVSNKHGGWVPRLHFKTDNIELALGGELRWHRSEHYGTILYGENLPAGLTPDYKVYSYEGIRDIYSVFARSRFQLTDDFALTAELQIVDHRYAIANEKAGNKYLYYNDVNGNPVGGPGELFNIHYTFLNPRLGATYLLEPGFNIYFETAITSHEPRMRNLYAADDSYFGAKPLFKHNTINGVDYYDFTNPDAKPETMLDIEIGSNYQNDNLHINANLYWLEYYDELIKSGRVDIFGNSIDINAPRSRHYGIELDAEYALLKSSDLSLSLRANATFSRNEISEFDLVAEGVDTVSLKGNEIPGFPSLVSAFGINVKYEGLAFNFYGKYCGSSRTDMYGDMLQNNEKLINIVKNYFTYYADNTLDSYFTANLDLSYTLSNIPFAQSVRFQLQVNNVFNTLYAAGAEGMEFFPAAERNFFIGVEIRY